MPNKSYQKGARLKRAIVNEARSRGFIAGRTTNSKSPVDCFVICQKHKKVWFIQAKNKKMSHGAKEKVWQGLQELDGLYDVEFLVVCDIKEARGLIGE